MSQSNNSPVRKATQYGRTNFLAANQNTACVSVRLDFNEQPNQL
jgi:hypothetical protein